MNRFRIEAILFLKKVSWVSSKKGFCENLREKNNWLRNFERETLLGIRTYGSEKVLSRLSFLIFNPI